MAENATSETEADLEDSTPDSVDPTTESIDLTQYLSKTILLIMVLIALNSIALRFRKSLHTTNPLIYRTIQDATITTSLGIITGAILFFTNQIEMLTLIRLGYENLFLIILLPPIIFESTLDMNKKSFFANIGSILMFSIFGTLIAITITAFGFYGISKLWFIKDFSVGESFAFGSLISSTDPVTVLAIFKEMNADKKLFALIFGESILNDAISITAYKTVTTFNLSESESPLEPILEFCGLFIGSLVVGFVIGLICAFVLKKYSSDPETQHSIEATETTIMIVAPWIAYLIGEGFDLSGIVAILFCGIAINKYAFPNMSEIGKRLTRNLYHVLASTFENIVFIFIGLGFFAFKKELAFGIGPYIFVLTILIITFARFFQVYFISCLINMFQPLEGKIKSSFKAVMANSGFRGAMAFALAVNSLKMYPKHNTGQAMLTVTLVYATLTIFFMGSIMVPLLDYYDVREKVDRISTIIRPKLGQKGYLWDKMKRAFRVMDFKLKKVLINPIKEKDDDEAENSDSSFTTSDPLADKQVVFLNENNKTEANNPVDSQLEMKIKPIIKRIEPKSQPSEAEL